MSNVIYIWQMKVYTMTYGKIGIAEMECKDIALSETLYGKFLYT